MGTAINIPELKFIAFIDEITFAASVGLSMLNRAFEPLFLV